MTKPQSTAIWTKLRAWLRRPIEEEDGVAAVEFAIILPLMIVLFFGALQANDALTIHRRIDQIAYVAADLVAQEKTTSDADLDDVTAAAADILAPYPDAPLSIVLTSVVADSDGKTTVDWSYAYNGNPLKSGNSIDVPDGLTEPGTSVVVAQVGYNYTPIFDTAGDSFTAFSMSRTFYTRPRQSVVVTKTD
ncbi:TadE/TadG family type IV pilus assembly protein [Methyloligella sp. 2.7D]|uniref:TadE/TadG family type IV pilus assembly protein n=1 Tax=unclassified Methyloligella TaxID=2625955 RepID=UPI00157C28EA|nr:TadE/TadG family type IV pilus assembly protein [Methyloligella sp. GL2]QKP78594.1 pilus assembly protein [Methyloligella sp. GL2]